MKLTIMEEGRSCHDGDGNAEVPIYDQDDICVASVWGPNDKETRAIAYKLAAAQELYDVCKYALSEQYGHTAVDEYLVDALETAIAKAEGKEAA